MAQPTMHQAMNAHLREELAASYLYLAMTAYCESINLPGIASWMRVQSEEEHGHAMKFYEFMIDRGWRMTLQALEQPPAEFGSPLEMFERALANEQRVTAQINQLYSQAGELEDYASQAFLQWFISEQVEEEKMFSQIVETLKMIGADKTGLLMLDRELGSRKGD